MSGFRILFRRIAEMLSPEENGPAPPPGFCVPPTSTQTPATSSGGGAVAVCHNPEHIEGWDAREISDYMNLCAGRQCSWIVPFAGNAFVSGPSGACVTQSGVSSWTSPQAKVSLFVHCVPLGLVHVALRVSQRSKSRIKVSFASCTNDLCQVPQSNEIELSGAHCYQIVPCGQFQVEQEGYVRIELEGLRTWGSTFGEVSHAILITESSDNSRVKRDLGYDNEIPEKSCMRFVADPEDFYFGRRGPSVHLNYVIPAVEHNDEQLPIEYFYNELYVPSNQDVVGAYFCSIGFSGGYFGIQVNSPTERRILFSLWSDYETDDPSKIPDDFKIALIKKGSSDVHTGEFGNEGSGGQSYLRYPWKPDTLYKFLVQARPLTNNETVFTAWFCDSATNSSYNWRLIARFRKPKVATYLTGLYSFSENFIPEMGHVERTCLFGNQWAKDATGNWREVTTATFSADATAQKQNRKDVGGGVVQGVPFCNAEERSFFYLRNCGFFSEAVGVVGERFCRRGGCGCQPSFDCNGLP